MVLIKDGPLGNELSEVLYKWRKKLGSKFRIVENAENLGLTISLNKGLKIVKGDYIARMDSDDISTPLRFKLQKEFLDNHPDIAIVGGSLQEFDSYHENLGVRHYPTTSENVLDYIYKASPLAHPTVMMRREIFDNGLSYNEKYPISQDIALWFDVLKAGYKIANLNEITIKFRREGDVFRRRSKLKAKSELKIYLNGIRRIYGLLTWRYIYPIARYCFRRMPVSIVRYFYGSNIRDKFLNRKVK
ncbi:MAG: glycosyltransferase [Muribaculaceae bacterium]|nr:glycosyltransferase [Muribaculaceae bacterium]